MLTMSSLPTCSKLPSCHNSPLNKKRRFVPNSSPATPERASSSFNSPTFNSPLFVHVFGQTPSESSIQTQLFQVGMRVRKSVNDGYQISPKQSVTGELARVPSTNVPGLRSFADSSSSFTTPERSWNYSTTNKRAFTRETEDDSDTSDLSPMTPHMQHSDHRVQIPPDYFNINYDFDGMEDDVGLIGLPEDSPSQKGVLRTRVNGRRIAMPKSRRQKRKQNSREWNLFEDLRDVPQLPSRLDRYQSSATQWLGHERSSPERRQQGNDFEEADFLQSREDVDMDCS